jgi:hypothetical protein
VIESTADRRTKTLMHCLADIARRRCRPLRRAWNEAHARHRAKLRFSRTKTCRKLMPARRTIIAIGADLAVFLMLQLICGWAIRLCRRGEGVPLAGTALSGIHPRASCSRTD